MRLGRRTRPAGKRTLLRRGSEIVEGMLVMLPFMALVFIIIDTAYGLFIKATIQYAVQSAVAYAAAGNTDSANGQLAGITETVQAQSLGLLAQAGTININFYSPGSPTTALGSVAGANSPGNIVEVDVSYPFTPLAPLFRSGATITFTASAAGALAANPPPTL